LSVGAQLSGTVAGDKWMAPWMVRDSAEMRIHLKVSFHIVVAVVCLTFVCGRLFVAACFRGAMHWSCPPQGSGPMGVLT